MTTAEHKRMGMSEHERSPDRWWNRLRLVGWSLAALILLLPFVAGFFTDEVNWGLEDYLFASIVLGGVGLLFDLAVRRAPDNAYRWGALVALLAAFLLVWSNAAVGIVGSGANTANALYFSVLAIALSGCWAAGFRAKGMSLAMFAAAVAQALVTLFAVLFDWGHSEDQTLLILGINAVFMLLWIASAVLLRQSATGQDPRQGSQIHAILSLLVAAIGIVLLTCMIIAEGEPGALPLFLVLAGLGWFLIARRRANSRHAQ